MPDYPEDMAKLYTATEHPSGSLWPDNCPLSRRALVVMNNADGPSDNSPIFAPIDDSMAPCAASDVDISCLHLLNLLDDARAPHELFHTMQKWVCGMIQRGILRAGKDTGHSEILNPTTRRTFTSRLRKHF